MRKLPFHATADEVDAPYGWRVVQIQDASIQLPIGRRYDKKSVESSGGIPVIDQSAEGFLGYHDDEPGVMASEVQPVVTFANHTCAMRIVKSPFSVIQNVFPTIGRIGICDTRFFYYATNGRQQTEEYKGHHPAWRKSYIALPGIPYQKRVAYVLGTLDDLIENNRRRIEVVEEMARVIYREWFIHFRYPGHEGAIFVDSPLGAIPKDWSVHSLGEVIELKYGKALKKGARRGGPTAVIGSSGVVGWHDDELVSGPAVIVGRKGNVGSVTWVDGGSWPIDTTYYVVTDLPLRYVVEQLRRIEFVNTHAAVPGLSRDQAYSRPFLLPERPIIDQFVSVSEHLSSAASALDLQTRKLVSIRDLLLPKLVTGQIDVSALDLEKLLEGTVG